MLKLWNVLLQCHMRDLTNHWHIPGTERVYLEMLCAELAAEELVLLPHVLLQLCKIDKDLRP